MLFVVLALLALESGRPLLAALASALGFQAKFLPGLWPPAWLRRFRSGTLAPSAVAAASRRPYWEAPEDAAAQPAEVRRVLAVQRVAFRALEGPARPPGAVRAGAAWPCSWPASSPGATSSRPRRPSLVTGPRCSWAPTSCPGTRCGCSRSSSCWRRRRPCSSPAPWPSPTSSTRAGSPASRGTCPGACALSSTAPRPWSWPGRPARAEGQRALLAKGGTGKPRLRIRASMPGSRPRKAR